MDKISEKAMSALYKVSTDDYESTDFYIHLDLKNRLIKFYLDPSFEQPVYVVDCNDKEQPINNITGVHRRALLGSISKALKLMDAEIFPDKVSYSC